LQQHASPSRTLAEQGQRSSGPLQRSNELSADPTVLTVIPARLSSE
jgi:hypothetical protein